MIVASNRYGEHMTCGDTWTDTEQRSHECGLEIHHEGVCCCSDCGHVRLERRRDPPLVFAHEVPETHIHGHCSVENLEEIQAMDLQHCDFGYQMGFDGRVWICVNGVAFLRFKPETRSRSAAADPHTI